MEFEVKSLPGVKFRTKKVSPVDLLALSMSMDLKDFESNKALLNFVLESLETMIGEKWMPVKVKGRDVFMPTSLDTNVVAISELTDYFMEHVLNPVFQSASE